MLHPVSGGGVPFTTTLAVLLAGVSASPLFVAVYSLLAAVLLASLTSASGLHTRDIYN